MSDLAMFADQAFERLFYAIYTILGGLWLFRLLLSCFKIVKKPFAGSWHTSTIIVMSLCVVLSELSQKYSLAYYWFSSIVLAFGLWESCHSREEGPKK
jgi:hypothetical protein